MSDHNTELSPEDWDAVVNWGELVEDHAHRADARPDAARPGWPARSFPIPSMPS